MTKHLLARLQILLLFSFVLLLGGCTTGMLSQESDKEEHQASAARYLQMAEDPSSSDAFEYHLRAVDHYLKANQLAKATRILRDLQGKDNLNIDLTARNQIVEVRLSLLKQDTQRAQILMRKLLAPYAYHVETPMPAEVARPKEHKKIALLLPSKGPHAEAAKTIREGFLAAYYKNAKQDALDPSIKVYDTSEGVVEAYHKAATEGVDFIVGPLTKPEVQALSNIKLEVPALALNTLQSSRSTDKLYQFGLMPEDELAAIADKAARAGHQRGIILGPQTEWGQRMIKTFAAIWKSHGGKSIIIILNNRESLDNQIQAVLKQAKDSDMLFLAASPELARQIKPLLNFYKHNLPVYATASVYSGNPSPKLDHDLDGIHFCDIPWVVTQHSEAQSHAKAPRYFALGMDAYSLATQLSHTQSLPKAGISGVTGVLRLDGHRVQRQLISVKFEQGIPIPD